MWRREPPPIDRAKRYRDTLFAPFRWHMHVIAPRIRHNYYCIFNRVARSILGFFFRSSLVVTVHEIDILRSGAIIPIVVCTQIPSAFPSSSESIFLQRGGTGCSMTAGVRYKWHRLSNPPLCAAFIHPYVYHSSSDHTRKSSSVCTKILLAEPQYIFNVIYDRLWYRDNCDHAHTYLVDGCYTTDSGAPILPTSVPKS